MRERIGVFVLLVAFMALTWWTDAFAGPIQTSDFDVASLPVGQVVSLYYREAYTRPYLVCNDVLVDTRLVSVRAGGKVLDGPGIGAVLAEYGFEAVDRQGVLVVCKKGQASQPVAEHFEPWLYKVRYRDSGYLVDLLAPLFKGAFANKRGGLALAVGGQAVGSAAGGAGVGTSSSVVTGAVPAAAASSVSSSINSAVGDDYLVFSGSMVERARLQALLAQLDAPLGEVLVKAYMYEVGKSDNDVSAVQLVAGAVGSVVSASVGGDLAANLVRLRAGSVEAVASALSTDSRFKVVSSPYVRLRSGKTARFVSGGTQSVLGAIVTNVNGSIQQSYDRVDSGTILEVSPVVRGDAVDVDLFQQVSNFTAAPGVASGQPPVLNKRELRTSLSMSDGEVVVLAGLKDEKNDAGSSGLPFLPFKLGKSSSASSSELVLVLEMKRL
jgi:type II secretory pathway component GspD/PulD (secretin)